jgi:hypothetical protein
MSSMKCIVSAAALVLAVAWTANGTTPAWAQITTADRPGEQSAPFKPSDIAPNPHIEVGYVEPRNPAYRPLYEKLKERRVLEDLRAFLSPLRLPRTIQVKVDECGGSTAHYRPGGPVNICYESVAALERTAPSVTLQIGGLPFTKEDAVAGAFVHAVLHEVARAVFDILEIPVWGREEHAADRVAGYMMFQFGEKVAYRTLVGTAWFLVQSGVAITGMPTGEFSYVREVEGGTLQRFYNTLCIALGGDPARFAFLAKTLPEGRAKWCRWEFVQLQRSFADTFMPHVDRELLKKVQLTEWLPLPAK